MSSPLSVMAGNKPDGLETFIETARPRGVYSLNNRLNVPGVETVLRFQDDVWGRLPDACQTPDYWRHHDPVAVALYELTIKKKYIPKVGPRTWLELMSLDPKPTYCAPFNEAVIVRGAELAACATWWNAFFLECCRLIVGAGLRPCLGGFATGDLPPEALPYLTPMFRAVKAAGGVIDVHEYGVGGYLMLPPLDRSGALGYRALWAALPEDARCDVVVSECGAGGGFTAEGVNEQLIDLGLYGLELARDWPRLRFACWFQLDRGAESHIDAPTLVRYADLASNIVQVEAPPVPDPDPVRRYARVCHLLPPGTTYDRVLMVQHAAYPERQTVLFSIDDAFITHPNLTSRTVHVWNMAGFSEFHGRAAELEAWVAATYPGPIVIVYREFPV